MADGPAQTVVTSLGYPRDFFVEDVKLALGAITCASPAPLCLFREPSGVRAMGVAECLGAAGRGITVEATPVSCDQRRCGRDAAARVRVPSSLTAVPHADWALPS